MNETASFKCNLIKKTIILFVYTLFVFIFLFLSISTSGLITLLFCTLFVIVLFIFIDTLLFQELIVTKNEIIKRWLIGHIEIKCSDLKVSLSKRLFTGEIMFIDTHVHLNNPILYEKIDQVINEAKEAKVTEFIVVGYDLETSKKAIEIAEHMNAVMRLLVFILQKLKIILIKNMRG